MESCSQPQLVWIKTVVLGPRLVYSYAAAVSIISVILCSNILMVVFVLSSFGKGSLLYSNKTYPLLGQISNH